MALTDSFWDAAAARMDEAVDDVLGDRLRYRHNGVWLGDASVPAANRVLAGFVVDEIVGLGMEPVDETLGARKRVKVSRADVGVPSRSDRIAHPRLGEGWYQPAGALPEAQGRYWIFDVQAASAPA